MQRDSAVKGLLKTFYLKKGATVYNMSIEEAGVTVRFRLPFGPYSQKKIFLSWNTIDEIQKGALR